MFIIVLFFISFVSANQGTCPIGDIFHLLYMTISWLWVIPAILAGKFLTNEFVYGYTFGIDKYLFQLWNIIKTFAFFVLGFLFFAIIIKGLIKGDSSNMVKDTLLKIILSSILIYISWFMVGAIIDISTIMTVAIGSFPRVFYNNDDIELKLYNQITVDFSQTGYVNIFQKTGEQNIKAVDLLPTANDFSGPLIYFGSSVLKFFEITNNQNQISCSNIFSSAFLKFLLALFFIIPLIVLSIISFVRIFYIWIFIIFMPFVVIDMVFKGLISSKIEKFKGFSFSNFLGLVFVPPVIIGILSLIFIFAITIQGILQEEPQKLDKNQKVIIIDNDAGNLNFVGYIMLYIFIVIMIWTLVPLAFKVSTLTSSISDGIFTFAKDLVKATPLPGVGISYTTLKTIPTSIQASLESFQTEKASKTTDEILKTIGIKRDNILLDSEVNDILAVGNILSKDYFFEIVKRLKGKTNGKNSLSYIINEKNFRRIAEEIYQKANNDDNNRKDLKLFLSQRVGVNFHKDSKEKDLQNIIAALWLGIHNIEININNVGKASSNLPNADFKQKPELTSINTNNS